MTFAHAAKAQDESAAIFGRASLVRMPDDTRIEQSRRFKRVFVKKICADQTALRLIQLGVRRQRLFHIRSARLENIEQIPVTTIKIIEHVCQLLFSSLEIEAKNPVDDVIGPGLIGGVEVSGLSRRFEGPDDHPGRIRAQIQGLAIQEAG